MLKCGFQQGLIAAAKIFEFPLESPLKSAENRLGRFRSMLVAAHDVHHQRGNERSREQVAGQHGEADRLGQRHEQELGDACQEEHRHKHDADAESGDQRRDCNLLCAIEDGLAHFLAQGKIALDVFDLYRGVVYQNSNGQRQTAKGHDVDGFADSAQQNDGDEDGQRNRDGNDNRGAPVPEKNQDHASRQRRCDQAFP